MVLIRLTSNPREKSHDFTTRFSNLRLDYDNSIGYEVALINASLYYNYHNVSEYNGNNLFKYNNGTLDKVITIPDGIYTFTQLIDTIEDGITGEGDVKANLVIVTSNITGRVTISLLNSYTVSFSGTDLHTIFGFNKNQVLTGATNVGDHHADITNGVSSVSINSSLTNESYENGKNSDVIYTFSPSAEPGSLVNITPSQPVYIKTNLHGGDLLRQVRISIEDGLSRPVNLNNESVSILLDLKPISPEFNLASSMMTYFLKSSTQ